MTDKATRFRFKRDGEIYALPENFLLAEILWVNRYLGMDLSDMGTATTTMVSMFLVVRRAHPQQWTAKTFETLSTDDFEVLEDEPEAEEEEGLPDMDPTAGTALGTDLPDESRTDSSGLKSIAASGPIS